MARGRYLREPKERVVSTVHRSDASDLRIDDPHLLKHLACSSRSLESPSQLLEVDQLTQAPILIVDDNESNIYLLTTQLAREGYRNLHSTTDSRRTLELIDTIRPSLLLLDLHMPELDGFGVMQQIQSLRPAEDYLPILVLTADASPETRRRALNNGAHDFLHKPFDMAEVHLRVSNLLRTQALYAGMQRHNATLEQQVAKRTQELEHARLETLHALALAAEFRDDETARHTERVGRLAATIGKALGLPLAQVELLHRAAPLHDIGKIGIPDQILLKPGRLTADEFRQIQAHTSIGFQILAPCQSDVLRLARQIALTHHERWDGTGYPHGMTGELIPLSGRIVAVADAFDAMTRDRPYQAARPVADALDEIARESGRQFDPAVADVMIGTIESRVLNEI